MTAYERKPVTTLSVADAAAQPYTRMTDHDLIQQLLDQCRIRKDSARSLLSRFSNLSGILEAFSAERHEFPQNVSPRTIALFQAIHAVRNRDLLQKITKRDALTCSEDTRNWLRAYFRYAQAESFGCIFLTARHHIIAVDELFSGSLDGTPVYPREVIRAVLQHNAAAIMLFHNHPSGSPEPSQADIVITRKVRLACETIDVRVLDHIVVGREACVSMAERGLM